VAKKDDTAASRADQALSKANEAIAIRPKRGKLTLLSRRIYNVFLYHAQRQGVDNANYTILLSELIDDARFTYLKTADKSDPLNQLRVIGWKVFYGTLIENNLFFCRTESSSAFSTTFG
jgi:hypothetical protein